MTADQINDEGVSLHKDNQPVFALEKYLAAYQLDPKPGYAFNIARAMQDLHRDKEALHYYALVMKDDPFNRQALINAALSFEMSGDDERAMQCYVKAMALQQDPMILNNLGTLFIKGGRLLEAIECFSRAMKLEKDSPNAMLNMAAAYEECGMLPQAVHWFKHSMNGYPRDARGHSNYLFVINCLDTMTMLEKSEEHKKWGRRHYLKHHVRPRPYKHDKIRIGYISPDFRSHVVGLNMMPIMLNHDRSKFDIYTYRCAHQNDFMTKAFIDLSKESRLVHAKPPDVICDMIRKDEIDILVDLAGQTADGRLDVMAQTPAPSTVHYLGYVNTTGLTQIDYRISDGFDHKDNDPLYTEKTIRLPDTCICYKAPDPSPAINLLNPSRKNGFVTFGSCNHMRKVNPSVVKLWSEVLKKVDGSKLYLKSKYFVDICVKNTVIQWFEQQGVAKDRLILKSWMDYHGKSHLVSYDEIDICLDTFPFTGGITSFEALWMGCPVVTLTGRPFVQVMTERLLTLSKNTGWITRSEEEYVKLAVSLASRADSLDRNQIRTDICNSVLLNGRLICKNLEHAFTRIYQQAQSLG